MVALEDLSSKSQLISSVFLVVPREIAAFINRSPGKYVFLSTRSLKTLVGHLGDYLASCCLCLVQASKLSAYRDSNPSSLSTVAVKERADEAIKDAIQVNKTSMILGDPSSVSCSFHVKVLIKYLANYMGLKTKT